MKPVALAHAGGEQVLPGTRLCTRLCICLVQWICIHNLGLIIEIYIHP